MHNTNSNIKEIEDIRWYILPLAIVTNGSIIYVIENIYLAQTMWPVHNNIKLKVSVCIYSKLLVIIIGVILHCYDNNYSYDY